MKEIIDRTMGLISGLEMKLFTSSAARFSQLVSFLDWSMIHLIARENYSTL
jgi:hypothetical protein